MPTLPDAAIEDDGDVLVARPVGAQRLIEPGIVTANDDQLMSHLAEHLSSLDRRRRRCEGGVAIC